MKTVYVLVWWETDAHTGKHSQYRQEFTDANQAHRATEIARNQETKFAVNLVWYDVHQ